MAGDLLHSKRFWTMIVGAAMLVLVQLIPALAPNADTETSAIIILIGALIGGYTVTDAVESHSAAKVEAAKAQSVNATYK